MASAAAGSIGRGLEIQGELTGAGDLVIEGRVAGKVRLESHVTIAPGGRVDAEVRAERLTVAGEAHGRLEANGLVEIVAGAVVTGELRAPRIVIADGASFSGSIEMDVALPPDL